MTPMLPIPFALLPYPVYPVYRSARKIMASGPTTRWMSEPDYRGTFRLLTSCLITLSLCVYTALHLNVPERGTSRIGNTLKKVKWVLVGIFAPELVVFVAWSQWISARELTKIVDKHLKPKDTPGPQKTEWTLTHSYFAQMGGFAFDTSGPVEDTYIPKNSRLFLTANGVALLAEMGHLPSISKEFILDKSKADSLAKTLVIVQAGWLVLQCIARVVAHLPLSMLELNTIAHAACALIVYFLWWEKPLDIRDPVTLSGPWVPPIAATMWMFSSISTEKELDGLSTFIKPPEIESLVHLERLPANEVSHRDTAGQLESDGVDGPITDYSTASSSLSIIQLPYGTEPGETVQPVRTLWTNMYRDQVLLPFGFGPKSTSRRFRKRMLPPRQMPQYYGTPPEYYTPPVSVPLNCTTLNRWRLASQCFKDHPDIWAKYRREVRPAYTVYDNNVPVEVRTLYEYPKELCQSSFVDPRIQNWPKGDLIQHRRAYASVLFLSICVLIYGGLHAAAWNGYFPTDAERFLWRLSTVYIACSGLLYAFMIVIEVVIVPWVRKFLVPDERLGFDDGILWCCLSCLKLLVAISVELIDTIIPFLVHCTYIAARSFIVVEAFLSLRDLLVAVYQIPQWTQYLSHL